MDYRINFITQNGHRSGFQDVTANNIFEAVTVAQSSINALGETVIALSVVSTANLNNSNNVSNN